MARSHSLRRSLLTNLVFIVIAFGGASWLAMYWGERRIVETMCRPLISQTLDLTEQRLNAFFDPILRDVELLRFLGQAGELKIDEPKSLQRFLVPLLKQSPQVSGIIVADSRGHEYYLTYSDTKWRSRQMRIDEWGQQARWQEWTDQQPRPQATQGIERYDPRTRPWYLGALTRRREFDASATAFNPAERVHWTPPYRFFTPQVAGLTASVRFDNGNGRDQVIGIDVLLREISEFGILAAVRSAVAEFSAGVPATDDRSGIIVKCVTGFTSAG